jgi:cell division protein FtsX
MTWHAIFMSIVTSLLIMMHHFVFSTMTLTKQYHNENKITIFHYVGKFKYFY